MKLVNQNAIISGASQGLGFEIAKQFVVEGANVVLCARDLEQLTTAQHALSQFSKGNKIVIKQTDVAEENEVKELVATALAEFGKIDILVANAGIYGPKGPIESIAWDEWSKAIDINLKGTVLQCREILPHFKQRRAGRIIILSGGGATKPIANLSAYCASKAGVVRFAETLAEEVAEYNISVNSVAPGALNTRLLEEVLAAGPEKVGEKFYQQSVQQKATGGTSLDKGAELCVFLASSKSEGITGKLLSAVWDPWQALDDYHAQLKNSDIYTLRRIVPKDRGHDWGDM